MTSSQSPSYDTPDKIYTADGDFHWMRPGTGTVVLADGTRQRSVDISGETPKYKTSSNDTPDLVYFKPDDFYYQRPGTGKIIRKYNPDDFPTPTSEPCTTPAPEPSIGGRSRKGSNTDGGNTDRWSGSAADYSKESGGKGYGGGWKDGGSFPSSGDNGSFGEGWKD